MINDRYNTISKSSEGEYREKGSKFFCYLFPVQEKSDINLALEHVKKSHPKARHFCYAWGLGIDFEPHISNDDGEPSGSAGRPILGQLKSFEISDCLAIVVRYFGGTKLGIPGLIKAYKTATKAAIEANEIIEKVISVQYKLITTYEHMGRVLESVKKVKLNVIKKSFEGNVELHFDIPLSQEHLLLHRLNASLLGINPKELTETTSPDHIELTKIK